MVDADWETASDGLQPLLAADRIGAGDPKPNSSSMDLPTQSSHRITRIKRPALKPELLRGACSTGTDRNN